MQTLKNWIIFRGRYASQTFTMGVCEVCVGWGGKYILTMMVKMMR